MNTTTKSLLSSAVVGAAFLAAAPAEAFQIFQPNPGSAGDYIISSPPTLAPPYLHWDLRKYANCQIPWHIRFPGGAFPPLDVNLDGMNNNAADQMAVQTALTNALNAWQNVAPSIITFNMLGAAPAGPSGIGLDNFNLFSFANSLPQDDQQCVMVNNMAPAPGGVAGNRPFAPVVSPGPDGVLTTQIRGDDMVAPCIIDGGDGNADTMAMGDDVQIVAPGAAVPAGCNVIITAGPNGVLDTMVNNMPAGGADDATSSCVVAGADGTAQTTANNQGTAGVALAGLFFNNQTGEILEADVEFGARFWSVNMNGAVQPTAVRAGPDGDVDTMVPMPPPAGNDDVQNIAQGTGGLNQNTIVIGPGMNGTIETMVAAGDLLIQTTDLQMVATHEIGHCIGIAHPVPGRNSDDVQAAPVGAMIAMGANVVTAGADGNLATQPQGDDMLMGGVIVDGGNGAAETQANNAQTSNVTVNGNRNIMNPFFTTAQPTNHALSQDDQTACNWLYTPDLGDAPDPWMGVFNQYQTLVHTNAQIRMLNGQGVFQPGLGPYHTFNFNGPSMPNPGRKYPSLRFEWLGPQEDASPMECEARVPDMDAFDDGVTMSPLIPGQTARITVTIKHTNLPGRYDATDPTKRLYVNGYLDFPNDCVFNFPADWEIWWVGTPQDDGSGNATTVASLNFVPPAQRPDANTIVLNFDVFVPVDVADFFYCRYRLDYGEDEGATQNISGDLGPAVGAAQYGEVEDYPCATVPHIELVTITEPGVPVTTGPVDSSGFSGAPPYTYTVAAAGEYSMKGVTNSALPPSLTSDAATGEITGITETPGVLHPLQEVTDSEGVLVALIWHKIITEDPAQPIPHIVETHVIVEGTDVFEPPLDPTVFGLDPSTPIAATVAPAGTTTLDGMTSQAFPSGLSVDMQSGSVTGIPTESGCIQPLLIVSDPDTWEVYGYMWWKYIIIPHRKEVPVVPIGVEITTAPIDTSDFQGVPPYQFQPVPPFTFSMHNIPNQDPPPILSVNPNTGSIEGFTKVPGTTDIMCQVVDVDGFTPAFVWWRLHVDDGFSVPTITRTVQLAAGIPGNSGPVDTVALGLTPGGPFDFTPAAPGSQTATDPFPSEPVPAGLTVDPSTGAISGTPQNAGFTLVLMPIVDLNTGQVVAFLWNEIDVAACPADFNGDGKVDGADLGLLLQQWSPAPGSALGNFADLNGDGKVDGADLGLLLQAWGPCPGTDTR